MPLEDSNNCCCDSQSNWPKEEETSGQGPGCATQKQRVSMGQPAGIVALIDTDLSSVCNTQQPVSASDASTQA